MASLPMVLPSRQAMCTARVPWWPGRLQPVFRVVAFSLLGWFGLSVLPGRLGLKQTTLDLSVWEIARSVLIFLHIPLDAGYRTRRIGEKTRAVPGTRPS